MWGAVVVLKVVVGCGGGVECGCGGDVVVLNVVVVVMWWC